LGGGFDRRTYIAADRELIAYAQKVIGYALTGITREHALFFLHGTGATVNRFWFQLSPESLGAITAPRLSKHSRQATSRRIRLTWPGSCARGW
jgi:hypothetical protein